MLDDFTGSRFLVTGAASGIGEAVARRLLDGGGWVVSLDRNEPSLPVHKHVPIDLSDPSAIDHAVDQLDGPWNALINVAGLPGTAPDVLVFGVNFLGLRQLTEAVLPHLADHGAVVNVASAAGFRWPTRLPELTRLLETTSFDSGAQWFTSHPQDVNTYALSKEAVVLYTLRKAIEYAERGLRINAVLPGPVQTPILSDFETSMGTSLLDDMKSMLGRHAHPDEIAAVVAFLVSPASSWVNGQQLAVDGGILAGWTSGALAPPAAIHPPARTGT